MNKKQFIEFVPLTLFVLSGIAVVCKVHYSSIVFFVGGSLSAMIYFYAAFWLYAGLPVPIVIKIMAGLVFSTSIIACMFCLLNWSVWQLYSEISYAGLALFIVAGLVSNKRSAFKPLMYRCILFVLFLSAAYVRRLYLN